MSRLAAAFTDQAEHCEALGSPFMGRLLRGLAGAWPLDVPLAPRLDGWEAEDIGAGGASLPLRLCGGLHALVLSGRAPELAALYPPREAGTEALIDGVTRAMRDHHAFLDAWMDNAPQTNEVRRSIALIAVLRWLAARFDRPFDLLELGASGGLNLWCDGFALTAAGQTFGSENAVLTLAPEWKGPLPQAVTPRVAGRRGCDLNPLDPDDPEDALRLLAYLWPDQEDRIARTRAATRLARPVVDRADAADWIEAQLGQPLPHGRMIYSTVAWQYFPDETKARATRAIEAAGEAATEAAPLAWVSMENDGTPPGARLSLRLWPGDARHALGRVDFHGRWIDWQPPALP